MFSAEHFDEFVSALNDIAYQLKYLGNGSATDSRGALEGHAMLTKEGAECIASAIESAGERIGDAIESAGSSIAGELHGIGQEIGWGLDKDDCRGNHLGG